MMLRLNSVFLILLVGIHKLNACDCSCRILEIAVILDATPSTGSKYKSDIDNFSAVLEFMRSLTCRFNIKHRVTYSFERLIYDAKLIVGSLNITDLSSRNLALNRIDNFIRTYDLSAASGVQSKMELALSILKMNAFRTKIQKAPKILIIFSDGFWSEIPIKQIIDFKNQDIEIFIVAISDQLRLDALSATASSSHHILSFEEREKLFDLINERTIKQCDANAFRFFHRYNYNLCD